MKLVREELYKMCSRKIVQISFGIVLFCALLIFMANGPLNEHSGIGGNRETDKNGFAAIRQDRELAKKYEGELTDAVIQQMVEECGFIENVNGIPANRNYVNGFLTDNGLTNGIYRGRDEDRDATATIPLEESAMGKILEKPVQFAYIQGWKVLNEVMSVVGILTCLLVIIAAAPVFSDEYSLKTASVLLTTEHGKGKGIAAKIGAAVLFALMVFAIGTILAVLLCVGCYGTQGLNCSAGMLSSYWYVGTEWQGSAVHFEIWQYFLIFFAHILVALLMTCALTLVVSALCSQTYISLLLGIVIFVLPAAIWFYLVLTDAHGSFAFVMRVLMYCSPMYSCMNGTVAETTAGKFILVRSAIAAVTVIPSIGLAGYRYRNHAA